MQPREQLVHLRRPGGPGLRAGGTPGKRWSPLLLPTPGRGGGIRVPTHRWRGAVSAPGARGVPAGAATCPPGDSPRSPSRTCWRRGARALRGGSAPSPGGCGVRGRAGGCGPAGDASGGGARAARCGPGSRLALAEVAAAALPLRPQKAPEADSNFCQTRQRTWPPSHVAREGTLLPPPAPLLQPAGRLKGTCGFYRRFGRKGLEVFSRSSAPDARETPRPLRPTTQVGN